MFKFLYLDTFPLASEKPVAETGAFDASKTKRLSELGYAPEGPPLIGLATNQSNKSSVKISLSV